ncbi:hypothetical protein L6164_037280 [Bauhinia variegata]|uniref:Uncharacterized protein n=1 Tax=Bauhinia variegata TaxID=167791 RepID=A0ACB9KKD1_BAUVA|nr:hypothetical protein L6164_037280 [Bauhinia variegata]
MVQRGNKEITKEDVTRRMSYLEICHTTKYFSIDNVIGVGKKGKMYKAKLPNGCFIAVKRFYDSRSFKKQFGLEMMILGKYRHRNILPLVGFCIERDARKERILVYCYMSNGRLSDWLSDGHEEEIRSLLSVACDCIPHFPVQRPTMLEIYNKMSKIWERHEMNEDSKTSMQTEVTSVSSGGDEIVELET